MQCKICSSATADILAGQRPVKYHNCPDCGLIFLDPAHHLPPDQEKARYLLHENSLDNKGYVEMLEGFIAQAVLPYKASGKALDFGCGPQPVLAELLRRRGFIVDTYDLYFEAGPVLEGQTYDVITATEVFEHLKEPMATLEMLMGLLRPGGIIAMMTLLHRQDIEAFKNWWYPSDPTHVAFYCEKTLGMMARKAGLEFARCDGKNVCVMVRAPTL